ncbi:methyl-CpG-binding domain-containing protein 13 isoform X2 [Euphorbia lathyris]|uniref:methyl-CpG-binding domain-containing protein 13 isoform X2 n=1 Tax=Euphorbia lathyris TaxID=212925 RepID=UPI00331364C1
MKIADSDHNNCNSDDPLPDGWTVKVKVRPSGKKDKVVLENSEPEGLPPGWRKDIKVTKKGRKIRRDAYYTDPVSGYVFHSMKDALRYVKTGELGRLASKPKDKSSNNLELEDDEASSPAIAKKQKLEVNRTRSPNISDQSSNLSKVANDKHVLSPAGTAESTPVYEHISGKEGSQSNNSGVQENKNSMQKVRRNDNKGVIAAGGARSKEHSLDSETKKDESKRTSLGKSKKKKDLSLPCRTSKRLSGLPLDPTPELKTTNRARRAAVKQFNDKASTGMGSSHSAFEEKNAFDTFKNTKGSLESNKSKHPIVNLAAVGKVETENLCNEKPECASISPSGNQVEPQKLSNENAAVSDDAGRIQTDNVDNEKSGLYLDLPLGDLCQDPCIAFAIKTLTGISFDNADTVQVSTGSNSDFGGLATSEDHTRKEDAEFGILTQQGCMADRPPNNVVTPEQVEEHEISNKNDEKPGSTLNVSFADAWADPCIEFAIKTLTGAIPLDRDVVMQDCSQHNASSSQSQESSGMSLQNVAEISQSQILRASYNQGALVEPGLRRNKNMTVGYSDGTIRPQHGEQRSKGSER